MNSEAFSCQESLKALASSPAAELVGDTPLARHIAVCPECARIGNVVLERERSLSLALDSLTSRADPMVITDAAILASERHGTARFVRWLLVGALGVTIWFALDSVLGPLDRPKAGMEMMTVPLTCLTPGQGLELVKPYLIKRGETAVASPDLPVLTLRGYPSELAGARSAITDFEARFKIGPQGNCVLTQTRP